MKKIPLRPLAAGLAAALVLAACGGGGGEIVSTATDTASTPKDTTTTTPTDTTASFAAVLAQLNTADGMTSAAVASVFDSTYLDSGTSKQQVLDALSGEAAALKSSSDHSLFPQVSLDNVSVSNCNASNVCTLTGTLHNNDADATSVQITTKVVSTGNGGYRLLGDQLAS
jgi:hypothetical protein